MKLAIFSTALVCFFFLRVNAQQEAYLDPHLPLEVRVDDLISRMTPQEKIYQMMNNSPAIPRLITEWTSTPSDCSHTSS